MDLDLPTPEAFRRLSRPQQRARIDSCLERLRRALPALSQSPPALEAAAEELVALIQLSEPDEAAALRARIDGLLAALGGGQ